LHTMEEQLLKHAFALIVEMRTALPYIHR